MKATLLVTSLVLASMTALAQTAPPRPQSASGSPAAPGPQPGQDEGRFQEHKQNLLAHIADRIAKMQQVQSCVQAATNREQMKACRPPRPEGKEHPPE